MTFTDTPHWENFIEKQLYIDIPKENEDKTKEYLIEADKNIDLRKKIFSEFAKENITIFEMKKADTTLEDAFIKIVEDRPEYSEKEIAKMQYDKEIEEYVNEINTIEQEHPILVDKYILGKEVEVDAICDGEDILIPGIMEHLERAGVHSGDSISVYPTQTLDLKYEKEIIKYKMV